MENKEKDLRLVCWVPYNISEIQKGIQCQHATVELSLNNEAIDGYLEWARKYKTTMIYNGGTTNKDSEIIDGLLQYKGSLNRIKDNLDFLRIHYSEFYEPDLNNALTAVCCIIDYSKIDFESTVEEVDELSKFIRNFKFA